MEKKLRIAVWYNLPTGGARRALHDHIAGLTARGHHVECFRPSVGNVDWLPMPAIEHEIPLKVITDDTTYLRRVLKHVMRLTVGITAMKVHSQLAAKAIEKGGFDVLFANTCMQYHSPFIGRYTTIPSVLYLQEPNRFLYEALPYLPWVGVPQNSSWRRKLRNIFDLLTIRKQAQEELKNAQSYGTILVNSYFSRESVARSYGLDSKVCYLGIDTERYKPSQVNREDFILGVGAISTPKRVDLAIKAVACLPEPRRKLVWVSNSVDQTYLDELQNLAKKLSVEFDLRVLISDEELVSLIQKAGCVLYTPRLEPFGYVPLEAAACGTPVVTIAEGGVRETMADGLGWVADPAPEEIAQCIQEIFDDPAKASRQVLSWRDRLVEKWNFEASIDRIESHLLAALQTKG